MRSGYAHGMAYITAEARQDMLETMAQAIDEIARALADLGAAYELLDETTGDRLEAELFRPVQVAYGRAKRTHAAFAERVGLPGGTFVPADAVGGSLGVKGLLDRTLDAVSMADATLADLQDSMMPVEVGDPELRAGLAEVREILGGLRLRSRDFVRTLGR